MLYYYFNFAKWSEIKVSLSIISTNLEDLKALSDFQEGNESVKGETLSSDIMYTNVMKLTV